MQQNPWYGESLGNWYSYFSHSMGAFFALDSHLLAYFVIREMHGFPHQSLIVRENATKPFVWGEPGKLVLILFPYYGWFFPTRFPSYGILLHMGNAWVSPSISQSTGKCNKTHLRENLGNWCLCFSHIMDAFFPLDSDFTVYCITWEMHVFSH